MLVGLMLIQVFCWYVYLILHGKHADEVIATELAHNAFLWSLSQCYWFAFLQRDETWFCKVILCSNFIPDCFCSKLFWILELSISLLTAMSYVLKSGRYGSKYSTIDQVKFVEDSL